jgi:hypothetical protein
VVRSDLGGVHCLVSEEKWKKTQDLLLETKNMLLTNPNHRPRKRLEQIRGFLMYVARTYTGLIPYLIGFHLTIDSWRPNHGPDGWKLQRSTDPAHDSLLVGVDKLPYTYDAGPDFVAAVPRFLADIEALLHLTSSPSPPLRLTRPKLRGFLYYGFGDASGDGFGCTFQIDNSITSYTDSGLLKSQKRSLLIGASLETLLRALRLMSLNMACVTVKYLFLQTTLLPRPLFGKAHQNLSVYLT